MHSNNLGNIRDIICLLWLTLLGYSHKEVFYNETEI